MSGIVFAVVTNDPLTGKPAEIQADIDWNLGTAAVVAESVGGYVVAAPRSEWQVVPEEAVAAALAASKSAAMDDELARMLDAGEQEADLEPKHRKCDQGCKQQMNEGDHCFTCREPWPCTGAGEQEARR